MTTELNVVQHLVLFYIFLLTNISSTDIIIISGGDIMNEQPLTESLYYILLSLVNPNYGYGIMENINKLTNGRINMGAGTLYGAIKILLDKKYIELYSEEKESRRKKEYLITNQGRRVLEEEIKRLEELVKNGKEGLK